jgi:hypothetical protein
MRIAFKEWAVIVDALGRGDQIVILRKGGLHEGTGGFRVGHREFLLFPTQFHQQKESVLPAAWERFNAVSPKHSDPTGTRLEFLVRVEDWARLESPEDAARLAGQHVWRGEVITRRFDWGGEKSIFALAARVFRLREPIEIPMRSEYGGCKSWIELHEEISEEGSSPVLDEHTFAAKFEAFRAALGDCGNGSVQDRSAEIRRA